MDERENLVANEGFDWLYGEDADGSVVEDPPAIGAVTESGTPEAAEAAESHAPAPAEADAPFETHPTPTPPGVEETLQEPVGSAAPEAPEHAESLDPMDPFEDFGSFADFDAPVQAETPPAVPARPPASTPPPAPPAPPGPVVSAPHAPAEVMSFDSPATSEEFLDLGDVDASFGPPVAAKPVEAAAPPPPPAPPAPPEHDETAVMEAVSQGGGTSEIPVLTSRGDIIPAGTRKLSLREKLTPAGRGPKVQTSGAPKPQKTPGQTKKVLLSAFLVALSVATTMWRVDAVREFVFGSDMPSDRDVLAQFTPLSGYEYSPAPEGGQMMFDGVEKLMEEEYGVETVFEMKMVSQKGQPVGSVVVIGGPPDVINATDIQAGYRGGLGAGMQLEPKTVAGTQVYFGTMPQAQGVTIAYFVDPDGFFMTVGMMNRPAAEAVVKQLVRANV